MTNKPPGTIRVVTGSDAAYFENSAESAPKLDPFLSSKLSIIERKLLVEVRTQDRWVGRAKYHRPGLSPVSADLERVVI